MEKDNSCIFCGIIAGTIPVKKVLENDSLIAFEDINKVAPIHILIVPKFHIRSVKELNATHAQLLSDMMIAAQELGKKNGVDESGYRLVINTERGAGQSVFHVHMHFMAGRNFDWPPG